MLLSRNLMKLSQFHVVSMLITVLSLDVLQTPIFAQEDRQGQSVIPVAQAKQGFSAEQIYRWRQDVGWPNSSGPADDSNIFYFLHWEEFLPHQTVWRAGEVRSFERALNRSLGEVTASSTLGTMSLDELLRDPLSRLQGIVVVHDGRIVYEEYPGMREQDHHRWFSVGKSITGLSVGLLEEEGRVDVSRAIDVYLPELSNTNWQGIPVIDILDMASGLDLEENDAARYDPSTSLGAWFQLENLDTTGLGELTSDQVLFEVGGNRAPGEVLEYSSMNTRMLDLLVERVSGQRVAEFVSDRVWSKLGAEGDAIVALNLDGRAGMYGMFSSRLRDLARYGMLYTPSWDVVATERVVPQSLLDRIRGGCRPEIFESGVPLGMDPGGERPRCNSRHWDAVFPDGDFFKLGARGQGLYISPARDVVVAFFSTTTELGWESYARAIAKTLEPSE